MPDASGGDSALIAQALRELLAAWAAAGDGWDDGLRAELDRDHIAPLRQRAAAAERDLAELATLIADAERACH